MAEKDSSNNEEKESKKPEKKLTPLEKVKAQNALRAQNQNGGERGGESGSGTGKGATPRPPRPHRQVGSG